MVIDNNFVRNTIKDAGLEMEKLLDGVAVKNFRVGPHIEQDGIERLHVETYAGGFIDLTYGTHKKESSNDA